MVKQFWVNLPVKDITKSKSFFAKLGFSFTTEHGNSNEAAGLIIGDQNVVVMLFAESEFQKLTRNEITDTKQSTEVLFSVDAGSRDEVDEMAKKAVQAGGTIFAEPREHEGWMYGCGFTDLDGHRWNVLYMDMSNIQKK
ncbi:VOC family protein [Paenibacillus sp. FA6]|uniref:VOC family protein n=1 Tax=Paenibacillus sp. FA6 TaxID=3413029 RepID=UPI003F65D7B8